MWLKIGSKGNFHYHRTIHTVLGQVSQVSSNIHNNASKKIQALVSQALVSATSQQATRHQTPITSINVFVFQLSVWVLLKAMQLLASQEEMRSDKVEMRLYNTLFTNNCLHMICGLTPKLMKFFWLKSMVRKISYPLSPLWLLQNIYTHTLVNQKFLCHTLRRVTKNAKMNTIRAFFNKSGQFYLIFQRGQGRPLSPPPSQPLVAHLTLESFTIP